jgi:uncharacterized protein (DUF1778 family)
MAFASPKQERLEAPAAEQAIRDHSLLVLTARQSRDFVEILLNPPGPNAALRAAAEHYKKVTAR